MNFHSLITRRDDSARRDLVHRIYVYVEDDHLVLKLGKANELNLEFQKSAHAPPHGVSLVKGSVIDQPEN